MTQVLSQERNPKSDEIPKDQVRENDPNTLESKNNLATLYKEQERYVEAKNLLLEGRRLKLGDTYPHTLESWHNLIDLYEAWNKPEKAKEWQAKLTQIEDFEE